jgi:hypothetical protein
VNRVHFKGRLLLAGGPEIDHDPLNDGFDGLRPAPGGTIGIQRPGGGLNLT